MKRKIFRILFALVLACSLSLVTAVPAAADPSPDYAAVTLVADGAGLAEWSTDEARSGKYSVELYPGTTDWVDWAGVQIASGKALTDFSTTGIGEEAVLDVSQTYFYYNIEDGVLGQVPIVAFVFEGKGAGSDETWKLVLAPELPTFETGTGEWVKLTDAFTTGHLFKEVGGTFFHWTTGADWGAVPIFEELGWWQSDATDSPIDDMTVDYVEVSIGMELATVFVDDATINDTTYDLQPPVFMDALFYQTGDTVTVTVIDPVANANPAIQESVAVNASIDSPANAILLGLLETGVNTGVFTETFTLVGTTPGTGELLVTQGSIVTVDYDGPTDTAEVDSVAPVVEISAPTDGDFIAGTVNIAGAVVEDNLDMWSLKIGGVEVATGTGISISYGWDTTLEDDGTYSIEVVATDGGGLVDSDSLSVTVDNTDPSIIDEAATPPTIFPAIETEVTFSANVTDAGSGIDLVEISGIPGIGTLEMLDEDADDIYTVAANITASAGTYVLTITATDSVDVGAANEGTATITLVVALDIIPPVITSPAITYLHGLLSARPGDPVTISANVTDDVGMGTVTAACTALVGTPISLTNGVGDIWTGTATIASVVAGDYTVTITATDAEGNVATDTSLTPLTVDPTLTGYDVSLSEDWNLISLPLIPEDAAIETVLAELIDVDTVSQVRTWVYVAGVLTEKVWISGGPGDLTQMAAGRGYWIEMSAADVLTATGRNLPAPPQAPPSYSVYEGWNMIGFKMLVPFDADLYLGTAVMLTFERMYGYDAAAGMYTVIQPDIDDLQPGQGYWLAVSADGTIYP